MDKTLLPKHFYFLLIGFIYLTNGNALFAQFVTNGSAFSTGGDCYQITANTGNQAGSVFSAATIDLNQPFNISAALGFGCNDGGADGIVFVLTTDNTALGGTGGAIGYEVITPSFAVEMDTWENGNRSDPAEDHMAIISNGSCDHALPSNLAGPVTLPNIEDCEDHCFFASWDPASQSFSVVLDGNAIAYSGDIAAIAGSTNVFYGFTASTGGATNLQTVCFGSPQAEPMDDVTICPGESVELQADPNGISWNWTPDPTLNPWNVSNPTATPTVTTTYSVVIEFACNNFDMDDVTVFVADPPPAVASSNSPLCEGDDLQLMAGGGISYEWAGPFGFSSNDQNPSIQNVDFTNAGTYTVTVTDVFDCTGTATVDVIVFPNPVVVIVPLLFPICKDADPVQMEGIPLGGTWSGAANANGIVDPALLAPGEHSVIYSFTDGNGCMNEAMVTIEIAALPEIEIFPAGPFCDTDPVQQLEADPPGGIWGGVASIEGEIDPQALGPGSYIVTYNYIDGNFCSNDEIATIEILSGTTVAIDSVGPFCESVGTQTLTASPIGGTWGGVANAAGEITPSTLGSGLHLVTYSITTMGSCPGVDSLEVEVFENPTATISGMGIVCAGSGESVLLTIIATGEPPFEITYLIDNSDTTSITVSSDTTSIPVTQPGVYTILNIIDGNGCEGTGSGSGIVEVVNAPQIINFDTECDATQTEYTVTFEITGGDSSTYTVTGSVPGMLEPNAPYIFTSQPIPSSTPYSFSVSDGNACDTITLSGNFACQCITEAGTMDLTPITVCEDLSIIATHNADSILDANDNFIFVIHSGNANSLGTIFGTGNSPTFSLVPPMLPGVTYYISAVAGDSDGMGGVDLNDPCLSVAFGTPVQWQQLPSGTITEDVEICNGETVTLVFTLSGNAPFDVSYSDGTQVFDLQNIFSGHTINVNPTNTTTYELTSVSDNSNPACSMNLNSSATVTVNQHTSTPLSMQICEGDSIVLAGAIQTTSGIYQDTLSTSQGCDSILISTLMVIEEDTTFLTDSNCNPANVGVFTNNYFDQNGCDSVVVLTVVFSETDTVSVNTPTCDPTEIGIFTNTFTTADGCDSTVIETFFLLPNDSVFITNSSCDPNDVGVFTFDLTNQWGCDSTVIETVSLLPSNTTDISDTSCDLNNVGVFTNVLLNQFGCDSTVILTVTFSDSDTTTFESETCDPALVGIFSNTLITVDGCDSVVIETVLLQPSNTVFISDTTCDPVSAGVFSNDLTNQFGCDSTVTLTVDLLPSDTVFVAQTSCEVSDTGTVMVVLQNQFGCDSTVITATTLLPPNQCGIAASLIGSVIPCGESTGALELTVNQGFAPFTYEWSGPSTGQGTITDIGALEVIGGLPPGTYTVLVTGANGLSVTVNADIEQLFPPTASASITSFFNNYDISCAGENDGSAIAVGSGGQPPYTYFWSNNGITQENANLVAGTYSVTITDANDCADEATVTLAEPPPLEMIFTVADIDCFGQSEGFVNAEVTGGDEPYEYSINGGPFQPDNNFFGLDAGAYQITAQDANGCSTSETILINAPLPVVVELGDNIEIDIGDGTTLHAIVSVPTSSLDSIIWTGLDSTECPTCLTQIVAPFITTTYSISVVSDNGCNDSDELTIFVDRKKNVFVPNAFSPNGDGLNEVFMIFAKEDIVANIRSFLVFDRWGESVFEYYNFLPNDPAFGWDGKYRDEPMNPQVLVWFAEIEFIDGEVRLLEGDVTIVR